MFIQELVRDGDRWRMSIREVASSGGIFGHSNVGRVIWDKGLTELYLD